MFQMVGPSYPSWKGIFVVVTEKVILKKHLLTFQLSTALYSNVAYKYRSLKDQSNTNSGRINTCFISTS